MKKYEKNQGFEKPVWLKYSEEEVKAIIQKLANKGLSAEKIGLVLRDRYGIPKVKFFNLKIKEVLGDKYEEPTLLNLDKKLKKIVEHYKKHHHDKKAERSLIITKAKFEKRKNYEFRKNKIL